MPDWGDAIRERLRGLNLEGARETEIVEELAQHLDDRYRELMESGAPEQRARGLVLEELETHDLLAEEMRRARQPGTREPMGMGSTRGRNFMGNVWHDLKVALRMIRARPAFSALVISMLAIGVAGNAAIFSVFNGLFLRPLPFPDSARLMDLDETAPKWDLKFVGISNPDFYNWQKGNATFERMAAYTGGGANLSDDSGNAQRIKTASVTYPMLDVLGLKPVVGRNFLPQEDQPKGPRVVLLGYDLWRRLFQGDRHVVGRVVKLSEQPYTIVGVLPPEAVLPPDAEAWLPLQADPNRGGSFYLQGVGRLKQGLSQAQAKADLLRVHLSVIQDPKERADPVTTPVLQPVRDRYLGDIKTVTRILLGAVGLVLLIACVNIAGLMLVRGEARSREIAIRTAVGASRGRIVRQLLTESLLLAGIGGVMGVLAGNLCLRGLISLMPDDLPKWIQFGLDGRFALFSAALTGAAAMIFGLAPALQAASVDAQGCLQEASRSSMSRGKRAVLSTLVVCEIALALVLLVSSGLLVQAFLRVLHVDPGFRAENVMTWNLRLPNVKYPKPEQGYTFFSGLIERLKSLPGITAASASNHVPLGGHTGYFYRAEGAPPLGPNDKNPVVLQVVALPGYFETMGITMLAGRGFEERDEAPKATPVAVINETFLKGFWPGARTADVLGKRIGYNGEKPDWVTVVGVTRDTKHYGLDQEMKPSVFVTFPTNPQTLMTTVVRSAIDPRAIVGPAREVIRQMDRDLPMFDVRTMSEKLGRSLWVRRAYSWLFAAFAATAILLAAAGIYGVVSFAVSQRTREIGIRMALGARPARVLAGVLGSGMLMVAVGVALGLGASLAVARLLKGMLFGVSARDAATYAVVIVLVVGVGALANYVPARRAAKVDPMRALRFE